MFRNMGRRGDDLPQDSTDFRDDGESIQEAHEAR